MDDEKFDSIIKERLASGEDIPFDPAALASLHHRLAEAVSTPWYVTYRTELFNGTAIALGTALIIISQMFWYNYQQSTEDERAAATLQQTQLEIAQLRSTLEQWKTSPPDTIRIIKFVQATNNADRELREQLAALRGEIMQLRANQQYIAAAGQVDGDPLYSASSSNYRPAAFATTKRLRVAAHNDSSESVRATADNLKTPRGSVGQKLSTKTIRDLERHYQHGVGLRLSPVVALSRGIYRNGSGQFGLGYGILADVVFSPSISLETGILYFKRNYDIADASGVSTLPGVDESNGLLRQAEIDNWMVEVPLNLRYHYPLSTEWHGVVGVGYSPSLYLKQVFEYTYDLTEGDNHFETRSTYQDAAWKLYAGTVNVSLGARKTIKRTNSLEASVFYQHGISTVGLEGNSASYVGLSTKYWFTAR